MSHCRLSISIWECQFIWTWAVKSFYWLWCESKELKLILYIFKMVGYFPNRSPILTCFSQFIPLPYYLFNFLWGVSITESIWRWELVLTNNYDLISYFSVINWRKSVIEYGYSVSLLDMKHEFFNMGFAKIPAAFHSSTRYQRIQSSQCYREVLLRIWVPQN